MNRKDLYFFEAARKEALKSDYKRIHIGCILVYKNKIIASGKNSNKTSPMQKKYRQNARDEWSLYKEHAEISALSSVWDADLHWRNVAMYIYRIRNITPFGMARPCAACMAAIAEKGIKEINYTTDEGFAKEIIIK